MPNYWGAIVGLQIGQNFGLRSFSKKKNSTGFTLILFYKVIGAVFKGVLNVSLMGLKVYKVIAASFKDVLNVSLVGLIFRSFILAYS